MRSSASGPPSGGAAERVSIYEAGLEQRRANHAPLTPLTFIERAASLFPSHTAVVHGDLRYSWGETYARTRRLASALARRGIGRDDTVAVMLPNVPAMYEAHFGIPMAGAVINCLNIRLDAKLIAFMLDHGEAKAVFVDPEFASVIEEALTMASVKPLVVDVPDAAFPGARTIGDLDYESLVAEGDPDYPWTPPDDEWRAIALSYTSGTTGNPKGVVTHHRGAHLTAVSNIISWNMGSYPVYLWTLPMFHCNGWCMPWSLAATNGTSVCLRAVRAEPIYDAIRHEKVDHLCGAPIVLNLIASAPDEMKQGIDHRVKIMTAASPPPAAVLEKMARLGFDVTHVYGLTETYGPAAVCAWNRDWDALPIERQAELKARQGVRYPMLDELAVLDPETLAPVPADGETLGEVFFRGNLVMKGYLKNPAATEKAFEGGWFHSGDLAVMHPDGYLEVRDRSKDVIISGGENISSIEVEGVLYRHPAVAEAAVVARPDDTWGETPCAFVTLVDDAPAITADELVAFCREHMAHYKVPKTIVFGALPKTSTGKVQKFLLRDQARALT